MTPVTEYPHCARLNNWVGFDSNILEGKSNGQLGIAIAITPPGDKSRSKAVIAFKDIRHSRRILRPELFGELNDRGRKQEPVARLKVLEQPLTVPILIMNLKDHPA
jgi:hypothetical protein